MHMLMVSRAMVQPIEPVSPMDICRDIYMDVT